MDWNNVCIPRLQRRNREEVWKWVSIFISHFIPNVIPASPWSPGAARQHTWEVMPRTHTHPWSFLNPWSQYIRRLTKILLQLGYGWAITTHFLRDVICYPYHNTDADLDHLLVWKYKEDKTIKINTTHLYVLNTRDLLTYQNTGTLISSFITTSHT